MKRGTEGIIQHEDSFLQIFSREHMECMHLISSYLELGTWHVTNNQY